MPEHAVIELFALRYGLTYAQAQDWLADAQLQLEQCCDEDDAEPTTEDIVALASDMLTAHH